MKSVGSFGDQLFAANALLFAAACGAQHINVAHCLKGVQGRRRGSQVVPQPDRDGRPAPFPAPLGSKLLYQGRRPLSGD